MEEQICRDIDSFFENLKIKSVNESRRDKIQEISLRYENKIEGGNFIDKVWYSLRLFILQNSRDYRSSLSNT